MLQPRAHAGVGDRGHDGRCREARGVVFDVKAPVHHVRRHVLHAVQLFEAPLDDDDFLAAVSLPTAGRLRVGSQVVQGAVSAARVLDVLSPCSKS